MLEIMSKKETLCSSYAYNIYFLILYHHIPIKSYQKERKVEILFVYN